MRDVAHGRERRKIADQHRFGLRQRDPHALSPCLAPGMEHNHMPLLGQEATRHKPSPSEDPVMKTFAISSSVVSAAGGEPVHIMRVVFFSNNSSSQRGRKRMTGQSLYYPRVMMRTLGFVYK